MKELRPDAVVNLGRPPTDLLRGVSRVIVSPGIPDSDPFVAEARKQGLQVISDIALFVAEARAPFVAVTGSNGKSTVTTLIATMCDAAGKRSLAGANLGTPALDLLTAGHAGFLRTRIVELSIAENAESAGESCSSVEHFPGSPRLARERR